MGIEIERKFLVADASWREHVIASQRLVQGYLVDMAAIERGLARASVRVRIGADAAWINVKSAGLDIQRSEFEYPLPVADAQTMLEHLCTGQIEKVRHIVPTAGHDFEVDEFLGDNAGLVLAELELPQTDAAFPHPSWLGREVSDRPRYYNVNLIAHPWCEWSQAERAGDAV